MNQLKCLCFLFLGVTMAAIQSGSAGEIGFIEDFALAKDRNAALEQLIPGTEDDYYYHALHYQNLGQYDRVEEILKRYIKQHKYTQGVREIQYRQALLTYPNAPKKSLEFIRSSLGIHFNHERQSEEALRKLPTSLDPQTISRESLAKRAFKKSRNVSHFTPDANEWLLDQKLTPEQRRDLLARINRPDHDKLVEHIILDLNHKGSRGFGSLSIHSKLLLSQLEECIQKKPALLNDRSLVDAYLRRLSPNADVDIESSPEERKALLDRQWKFASRLKPNFNSLKVHLLYHRLAFDRDQGDYSKQRLMTYLRLPRQMHYVARGFLQSDEARRNVANLNQDFQKATLCVPVRNDEQVIRDYLAHFFLKDANTKAYEPYVDSTWLKHLFAETKLINGLGDAERWYAMLPPAKLQQLRDRIDLDFAATTQQFFDLEEPVELDLDIKNVKKLLVKIYRINTLNYFRRHGRDVNTDIKLDGLIANEEQSFTYDVPAIRRERKHFKFPQLSDAGVYVIDFVGNGRSSRAVIRKGLLRSINRVVSRGHLFTILDAHDTPQKGAKLWLNGHEYTADDDGQLIVPFSNTPQKRSVVLTSNGQSSVDVFNHQAEQYEYTAGIHVDRESLVKHEKARLLVRHGLMLNGTPVSLKLLTDPALTIKMTDLDGIETRKEVKDFTIWEDRESEYVFQVPPRLATIQFTINAKLEIASKKRETAVSSSKTYTLNEIDRTEELEDLHFTMIGEDYYLELLGKSGEERSGRPVQLEFRHREFTDTVRQTFQTDKSSRIKLGKLKGIAAVSAKGPSGTDRSWNLIADRHSQYGSVHALEGEIVSIPAMGIDEDQTVQEQVSLLELRGGAYTSSAVKSVSWTDDYLKIKGLSPGDYSLHIKPTDQFIRLRIAKGVKKLNHVFGDSRHLELRNGAGEDAPIQIGKVEVGKKNVRIKLANANKFTRVHVFASRFQPAHVAWNSFASISDREPTNRKVRPRRSLFKSGRQLGEEEQYILDRLDGKHFPGNMLERPSMLLNPWDLRATDTDQQVAADGDAFSDSEDDAAKLAETMNKRQRLAREARGWSNLDFLAGGSPVLLNLTPDDEGYIEVARTDIEGNRQLQIVAVDPLTTVYRMVSLPDSRRQYGDLRLVKGLDPEKHYTRQKSIQILAKGDTFNIADISSARFASYDRLGDIYKVLLAQNSAPNLAEFEFALRWHELDEEKKSELYSKYSCHELNFYLMKKDPDFFESTIKPYIAHKYHKTFLDHWMLGSDLSDYLQPWNYQQLNVVERILLGKVVKEDSSHSQQHIDDLFALMPRDITHWNGRFEWALAGKRLDAFGKSAGEARKFGWPNELSTLGRGSGLDKERPIAFGGGGYGGGGSFAENAPSSLPQSMDDKTKSRAKFSRQAGAGRGAVRGLKAEFGFEVLGQDENSNGNESKNDSGGNAAMEADMEEAESLFFGDGAVVAGAITSGGQFYQKLESTREWAENNYYRLPIEAQNSQLVTVNAFWADYANHQDGPFYSENWAAAVKNFTECMLALAVLDLPLESENHDITFDGPEMRIKAAGPIITLDEQVREVSVDYDAATQVLVRQNFYRRDDRYRQVDGQQRDNFVTDEFLIHTVYGCNVIVSNTSSSPQKLDILIQIPEGAIPVSGTRYTKTASVQLKPYQTHTMDCEFYFPVAGEYQHFPVHVSSDESLLGFAEPVQLNVVAKPTTIDTTSWSFISQNGTNQQVLDFLKENNPQRLSLGDISFRMKDKSFANSVYALLSARHVYNHALWSYGIKHDLPEIIGEYLKHANQYTALCGDYIESELLTLDPVARKTYQHLDFKPLVNARAHRLGRKRQILNDRLHQQYHRLLKVLSYRTRLDHDDEMAVTYYMLLQDRTEEAIEHFQNVNASKLDTRLQHDYFTAWLDCLNDDPMQAKTIADKYADYPVDKWRNAFASIRSLVEEVNGGMPSLIDPRDRTQAQTDLASKEPGFEFEIESSEVKLTWQNLDSVQVNYYLVDLELLFSRNPFVQAVAGQFTNIMPNESQTVELVGGTTKGTKTIPLPESLRNKNVMVEIVGGGKTRSEAYYANSIDVQMSENYGQLLVTHDESGTAIPRTYVKVYSRNDDGSVKFYKDGYTDIRGRFDYASLNTDDINRVQRFSLLVISEDNGAVVKEVTPPVR